MRIAYFASATYRHDSPLGGYAHMKQFIAHAVEMGHQIHLCHGGTHPHPAVRAARSTKLGRFLTLRDMDVLYYRVEYKPPRDVKWAISPRRQLLGSPVVAWEFNSVPSYAKILGETEKDVQKHVAGLRRFAPGCDVAFCVSQSISDYVRETIGIPHAVTVPNGSDPRLFHPDAVPVKRVMRNRLNAVWMGSAGVKWHNFDLLRDAAWLLWDDGKPVVDFHIIGQGMQNLSELPPNVHYHGAEQYEKLPQWLAAMDVGLNVYRTGAADFSCPLKLFDYMASGLTPVSTDQPQVREIFQKLGQVDLIVPTDDAGALARVLRGLAVDRERVRRQGAAARQLAVSFYNWRRAARDTLDVLQRLVDERHHVSAPSDPKLAAACSTQKHC